MPYCELLRHKAFLLLLYMEELHSEWLCHASTVFTLCNQTFFHPSLLSLPPPPRLLALLPVACFCVRISLCMDLGGVNSLGMFRVCRFCVSASLRVHWHRSDCVSTHPHAHTAAGAELGWDSGSHGEFGGVLVGAR